MKNEENMKAQKKFEAVDVIKSFYPLKLLRKIYLSIILFADKGILNYAASGAFYFLLSLIPLALIFMTILDTYLAGYGEISNYFFNFLSDINPEINKKFFEQIGFFNSHNGKAVFGIVGAISLIWSSRSVFSGMKNAFDTIFDDGEKNNFIIGNLIPFIFVPLLFVLSVLFFIAAALFSRINEIIAGFGLKKLSELSMSSGFSEIVTIVFIFGITFCFYKFLPARRPAWINAFTGAALFTLSAILIQKVFYKVIHIADYYLVYGVISVLIAGLFWVYILFSLFYLFAQFVYVQYKFSELEFTYYYTKYITGEGNFIEKALFRQPSEAIADYGVEYAVGDKIISKGDKGGYLFILISGKALSGKNGVGKEITHGSIFGASGALTKDGYSYDVSAETECLALKLPKDFYDKIAKLDPKFIKYVLDAVVK